MNRSTMRKNTKGAIGPVQHAEPGPWDAGSASLVACFSLMACKVIPAARLQRKA